MGRPSTSGYCLTCRARRVKCDRGLPSCQRCLRSGHTCRGYAPETQLRTRNLGISTGAEGSQRLVPLTDSTGSNAPNLLVELDLGGFRETMAFTYFFQGYAWASFWKPLIKVHNQSVVPLEYQSSLALVYGYFGLRHRDKATEVRGLKLYGTQIRQVKSVLHRENKAELAKITVSAMILGMFTKYAVDKQLFFTHHLGASVILEHCGPRYFQQEPLLNDFRSCRRVLTCQAFAQRSRCFLEQEQWKTLPFELQPKKASDYLLDILVDIPGIVEDIGNLKSQSSQLSHDELVYRFGSLTGRLISWRLEWQQTNTGAASQQRSLALPGAAEDFQDDRMKNFLHNPIEFQTLEQATDIFTYNAVFLYLTQVGDALHCRVPRQQSLSRDDMDYIINASMSDESDSVLLAPTEVKLFCQPAVEALRILQYLNSHWTADENKDVVILAPIGIVYCVLERQPELKEFIVWESLLPAFDQAARTELEVYRVPTDAARPEED